MANLSDATGIINVTSEKNIDYELFWLALDATQQGGYYNFQIEKSTLDTDTVPFYGTGRWTFSNNLKSFADWASNSKIYTEAKNKQYKDYLESIPFELHFQFSDLETGCEVACRCEYTIRHMAKTPLAECLTIETSYEGYDFNCYDLVKGAFCESYEEALRLLNSDDWDDEDTIDNAIDIFRASIRAFKEANSELTEEDALIEFKGLIEHIEGNAAINNMSIPSLTEIVEEFY